MQTHENTSAHDASARPHVPRPAATHEAALLAAKVDALSAQVAFLVERQKKQEELFAEMTPILKEVLSTATTRLDDLEKRGYFAFGREAIAVGQRVVEGYGPEDVRAFGDAIVSILDTVRALTQPEVLAVAAEAGKVLEGANEVQPLGIVGMVRSTSNDDVQKGMAVMMEILRHVGAATKRFAARRAASPMEARRQKLAETLGPRRARAKGALGIERTAPPVRRAAPTPVAAPAPSAGPGCAVPKGPGPVAAVIDGVAFSADGHLADPKAWTPELGRTLAAAQGVALTDAHWKLVEIARADFEETGVSPNIRRLTQIASLTTKDIYTLFPRAPARTLAKIAGTPKPAGCL